DPEETVPVESNGQSRAPRTALEAAVLEVWREVLGQTRLAPDDSVFEHGAHSMLAVQACNRLRKLLERKIPVVLLFQYPTVSLLAAQLEMDGNEPGDDQQTLEHLATQRREANRKGAARRRAARQN